MAESLHIWILSPYHTGSHKVWAEGYAQHSRHRVSLLTMAGRFWKWRMQGGAMELWLQARRQLAESGAPDLVLATDMVNLPAWLALARRDLPDSIPLALYMHENQLTYPWRPEQKPDLTYALINWLSQLVADIVLFNSRYHLNSWFDELPRLLKHFPDYNHLSLVQLIQEKSLALPVGIECRSPVGRSAGEGTMPDKPPIILWNQRWEYDKRPDRFFQLLYRLHDARVPFRLAVAGENFRNVPSEFEEARTVLADHIVHWGYVENREAYFELLTSSDLVISTADHEFFGISILEAICAGAFPLLPKRLSYPELVPSALHPACLYEDDEDLFTRARRRLEYPRPAPPSLREFVRSHFSWPVVARQYDNLWEQIIAEIP